MLAVLRHRNFTLLWVGQLISKVGDLLLLVALPYFVYDRTGSALATGAMFMVQLVPQIVFGSAAGVLVDRWNRKWTLVAADVLRGLVLLLLLLVHTPDQFWLIYVVAFVQAAIGLVFLPARHAFVPQIVVDGQLVAANALIVLGDSVAGVVAPPLGGVVLAAVGLPFAVLLDSGSYLFSAAMIALVGVSGAVQVDGSRSRAGAEPNPAVVGAWRQFWHDWRDGLVHVLRDRTLAAMLGAESIVSFGIGITAALFVVFLRDVFGAGAVELGWWLTAQGIGGLAAGALIGQFGRRTPPLRLVPLALAIGGALALGMANTRHLLVALALAALLMLPSAAYRVSLSTVLQSAVADHFCGRIAGTVSTSAAVSMLAGMLFGSLVVGWTGVVALFNLSGVLRLLAAGIALNTAGAPTISFLHRAVASVPPRPPVPPS